MAKNILKRVIMSLIIPVVVYLFFFILCNATGHAGFGVGDDIKTIIYTSVFSGLIALAMSINLQTGRFDFSVGATLVLSIIIGGTIAKDMGFTAAGLLIATMIAGAIIGAISGLVYILLGLTPMVVSLGLAMIYEAVGFVFSNAKGIRLIGKTDMLKFASFPNALILIIIVVAIMVIIMDYTKLGYNWKALQTGQKIATDVGINEKKNALICYIIAGVLLGIAGCVFISKYGIVDPETGLSSSSYFMTAFLPLFIGGVIEKYSSKPIGIFIGAITQAFITSGLTWLGCSSSIITVLNGVIVMAFLIYSSNSYVLVEQKMFKEKLEKLKAKRLEKQSGGN